MTVTHLKKKDVVKSSVKGVELEFDHDKLASILGVPGKNGICEYIKDVWEESKYTKPLEITKRFANDETPTAARRVKSGEMNPFQRFIHFLDHEFPYGDWLTMVFEEFGVPLVDKKGEEPKRTDYFDETFLTMCKLTRENGVWWVGTRENRRRDDDDEIPEEEGESGSDDQFFDAQVEVEEPVTETPTAPAVPAPSTVQQKVTETRGVDPSGPSGHLLEAVMNKLQAEFERARANRFQADLEKAQYENARLLALLQQAQFKPKP
ncbi:hypothetical protein Dimus_000695 [Dionaea muscipula]